MLRKSCAIGADKPAWNRSRNDRGIALPWVLSVPFMIQVIIVVSLVGYLSYSNGQRSVAELTNQLMNSVGDRIEQKLERYLESAQFVNQMNQDATRRGALNIDFNQPSAERDLYLWQQMQMFPDLAWISIGYEQDGSSAGINRPNDKQNLQMSIANRATQYFGTYYAMESGVRTQILKVERPVFDARTRPWYQEAIAAQKAIWTKIYAGFTPGTIFVAASQPLHNSAGEVIGVSGTDISLNGIQRFLEQTPVSPHGYTFLMERSGMLVASSGKEPSFRLVGGEPQRANVLDPQTPMLRAIGVSLKQKMGDFNAIQTPQKFRIALNQQPQFVQVLPFSMDSGLDWLMVMVVPESDVMAKIHAGTKTTIWLCIAAVAAVIGLNAVMSRWLMQPIVALSRASQQIALGDFSQRIRRSRIRELSTLTDSFTRMSTEIQQSRQQLEEYSRSLEEKVSDRTQKLQQEVQRRAAAEAALQSANQELQRLAFLDGLTQIANRRQFDLRLEQEWRRMKRERSPLALILCDVDYFKSYNDTYGHQMGDDCLRTIAKVIDQAARRPSDLAARYGGEEFAILLSNTDLEGAIEVAKVIKNHIQQLQLPHQNSQVSLYVTASFGVVAVIPVDGTTPEELVAQADQSLYQAKAAGRDQIGVAD
jgi:diguanylate cyclase (GGDEF)-like protein